MTDVTSSTVLVWFDQREFVRFGKPITLDETVDLTLGADDVWASPWERAVGGPIRLRAGRHAPGTDMRHVRVHVDHLWEARAQLEPSLRGGWRLPDHSSDLIPVDAMDFTTPDASSDTDGPATAKSPITVFRGWIMQATILADLPPRNHGWPYGIEPLIDLTDIGPNPRRVSDWAAALDASSDVMVSSPEGWTMRTPFFAAVQYEWHPSDAEFALGHPCIVEWADATAVIACYTSRRGMHHIMGVGDTEHYIRITVDEFIERSRRLLASPWSGFRNEPDAEDAYSPLEHWSAMFPHGVPEDLQRLMQATT